MNNTNFIDDDKLNEYTYTQLNSIQILIPQKKIHKMNLLFSYPI